MMASNPYLYSGMVSCSEDKARGKKAKDSTASDSERSETRDMRNGDSSALSDRED